MPLTCKEKSQRWRDRKKANAALHSEYLESERQRYKHRIQTGSRKVIENLSERGKRARRKAWKIHQKKCRERKMLNAAGTAEASNVHLTLAACPDSHPENSTIVQCPPLANITCFASTPYIVDSRSSSDRKSSGRRRTLKDRSKVYREIDKLKKQLAAQTKLAEKYKKALHRKLKQADHQNMPNTPGSKTKRDVAGSNLKSGVRRKLLFHNALMTELKLHSRMQRRSLCQLISGQVLRKYRVIDMVREFGCYPRLIARQIRRTGRKSQKWNAIQADLFDHVKAFYEREDNSRITAGKRETVTRNKQKRQIHYLCDTLKNLHAKYMSENVNRKISYISFVRLRPFWVKQQSVSRRDTCLCRTCDNLQLVTNKLHTEGIVTTNRVRSLTQLVSCDTSNSACMLNECKDCESGLKSHACAALLNAVEEINLNKKIQWNEWKTVPEVRVKRGPKGEKEFSVMVTKKVSIEGYLSDACDRFEDILREKAKRHFFTIDHQYVTLREMKSRMGQKELCIHIDFAENYSCKFSTEVQSVHFGASRNQVTLHNAVIYSATETMCWSTLSESMRHDPCAIWAYLKPILTHLRNTFPDVDILHFISDSPATQYRCKTNFFLFCTVLHRLWGHHLRLATWNYHEAGHGKGAPDGVGGLLKRTADRMVANGGDLPDAFEVYSALSKSQLGVRLSFVAEADVSEFDKMLPKTLRTVPGTMQIHQITTTAFGVIMHRRLSCYCSRDKYAMCHCYNPCTFVFNETESLKDTDRQPSSVLSYRSCDAEKDSVHQIVHHPIEAENQSFTDNCNRYVTDRLCAKSNNDGAVPVPYPHPLAENTSNGNYLIDSIACANSRNDNTDLVNISVDPTEQSDIDSGVPIPIISSSQAAVTHELNMSGGVIRSSTGAPASAVSTTSFYELAKHDGKETEPKNKRSFTFASDHSTSVPSKQNDDPAVTQDLTCDTRNFEPDNPSRVETSVYITDANAQGEQKAFSTKTFYGCRKRKPTRQYSPPAFKRRK